jgi:hypothetical protein
MGQGLPFPAPGMVPWANMFAFSLWTGDEAFVEVARHWYLDGLQAPDPVEIPWSWISGPLRFRQDKAFTYASVSKTGGGTAIAQVIADEQIDYTASLDAENDVDNTNLAHFTITYYDTPRTRLAQLVLALNRRTDLEIWTILGVSVGDRISITDVPAGWPQGADSLVVEGIQHVSRGDGGPRLVVWSTSPVIGEEVGQVGPFFRVGVSELGGPDLLPW